MSDVIEVGPEGWLVAFTVNGYGPGATASQYSVVGVRPAATATPEGLRLRRPELRVDIDHLMHRSDSELMLREAPKMELIYKTFVMDLKNHGR